MTSRFIQYSLKWPAPKYQIGRRVRIIPIDAEFTIENMYYIDGDGWRYISLTENRSAYEHQLAPVS